MCESLYRKTFDVRQYTSTVNRFLWILNAIQLQSDSFRPDDSTWIIYRVTVTSFWLQQLPPPCCRYSLLRQRNNVNVSVLLQTISRQIIDGMRITLAQETCRFLHFSSLSVHIKYTSNMAEWFSAQFSDVIACHVLAYQHADLVKYY